MIEIDIGKDLLTIARAYTDKYFPREDDPHPNNLFTAGDKDYTGLLGELIIADYFCQDMGQYLKRRPVRQSDVGYDIYLRNEHWDIKTLMSVVKPFPGYRYNVAEVQLETRASGFVFCTILKDYSKAFLCGYISKEEFRVKSIFHKKGDLVPKNGFRFPCNAYDIGYEELHDIKDMKTEVFWAEILK